MGDALTDEINRTRNRGGMALERTLISVAPSFQSIIVLVFATDRVPRAVFSISTSLTPVRFPCFRYATNWL